MYNSLWCGFILIPVCVLYCIDCLKVTSPCGDGNKETATKEDQLALDAKDSNVEDEVSGKKAQTFTFEELSISTANFKSDCFLGEGGFGKVYKGFIDKINQVRRFHNHVCFLDPTNHGF